MNNNAAAVLLALAAVAGGKAVLVSRGELVEIGGGFRIPEVLARSGARMVEVGTTNKTRDRDYAEALEAAGDVAAILRVHPGNFRQTGFVERPSLDALVALARPRGVAILEDLGGGLLVDPGVAGLEHEPLVRASIASGADLVCFSTDKALGGPQGGAVVGRASLVEKLRRDPLARALRMGRLPLVALEATLAHLQRGELDAIPALAALRCPVEEVRARAEEWAGALRVLGVACEVVAVEAVAGGGAFAEEAIAFGGRGARRHAEAMARASANRRARRCSRASRTTAPSSTPARCSPGEDDGPARGGRARGSVAPLRVEQDAGVHDAGGIERPLRGAQRLDEERGHLRLVPGAMQASDGMVVRDRGAARLESVARGALDGPPTGAISWPGAARGDEGEVRRGAVGIDVGEAAREDAAAAGAPASRPRRRRETRS